MFNQKLIFNIIVIFLVVLQRKAKKYIFGSTEFHVRNWGHLKGENKIKGVL